jgi:hypothetical protein
LAVILVVITIDHNEDVTHGTNVNPNDTCRSNTTTSSTIIGITTSTTAETTEDSKEMAPRHITAQRKQKRMRERKAPVERI